MCNNEHQNKIFLSIILPVYNVAQYIPRLMKSLLDPRLPHDKMEIIFVDDCSPDNSAEIIESFSCLYNFIQLIYHKQNKRQGGARNTGLKAAKGEYVFFVDPDDEIIPEGLLQAISHLMKSSHKLDVAMYDYYKAECTNLTYASNSGNVMDGKEFISGNEVFWTVWLCLYRRKYLIENNFMFEENVLYEDVIWSLKVLVNSKTVQYMPIAIYIHHFNKGSTTQSIQSLSGVSDAFNSAINIAKFASENHPLNVKQILYMHSRVCFRGALKRMSYLSYTHRKKVLDKVIYMNKLNSQTFGWPMNVAVAYPRAFNLIMCFIHFLVCIRAKIKGYAMYNYNSNIII